MPSSDPRVEALLRKAGEELELGRYAAVERCCRKALRLAPGDAAALRLLGLGQLRDGDAGTAVMTLRRAAAAAPADAECQLALGLAARAAGRLAEAIDAFRHALTIDPRFAPAQVHLGLTLRRSGAPGPAAEALTAALPMLPRDAGLRTELGHVLSELQRFADAEASYRAALALQPGLAVASRGLGNALAWQHRLDEARMAYRAARAAQPGWTSPLFHEAILDLMQGEYAAGFALYEHRLDEPALTADRIARVAPRWRGNSDPAGRTILLHDEQGFGDTFLFARYVMLLAARKARIVLEVRPPLVRLCAAMAGSIRVVARGKATPAHDLQFPLPSLPLAFATTLASVPREVPYLRAPAGLAAQWRDRLAGTRPLIAVTWATNQVPAYRSMPLRTLARLFDGVAARFVALQPALQPDEEAVLAEHPNVHRLGATLEDFADTAAVLEAADLVISVDTAVANLAGALGRPVWVALPYLADWRWGAAGDRCAWYPTARLFRQPAPGDWDSVIDALRTALAERH